MLYIDNMKTCFAFLLVLFLGFFAACKEKETTIPAKEPQPKVVKDTVSPSVNSHESDTKKQIDLTSKLKEKVTRLAALKYNYQLKILDTVVSKKTILLGGLKRLIKLRDTVYKDIDFTIFEKETHQMSTSFLKGTKPMPQTTNLYPRVTVEEYIFKTPESAQNALNLLGKLKKYRGLWTYIGKAPHDLFREENRIYFMSTGGHYMMGMEKDIISLLKE